MATLERRIQRLEEEIFGVTDEQAAKMNMSMEEAAKFMDGVKKGVEDVKAGRVKPWDQVKKELHIPN
ncbi:MAG: hypothetical protein ACYDHZ_00920 [Dehalococcoidia bacterium]